MSASESHPAAQEAALLKLYVFGSCESDQYYHPRQEMESKRPVCLTDLDEFVLEDEDEEGGETKKTVILNPLRTASISKIACGALHTVVSTVEGQVFTFGCNDEGALGREGPEKVPIEVKLGHIIDLISAGDNHSIFASSGAGKVYFTGNYKFLRGEKMVEPVRVPKVQDINDISGRPNRESRLTKVVSGSNHSVILLDGRVYTRGEPEAHTVGRRIMKRHQVDSSLKFEGIGLDNVEDVWCGGYHTLIKTRKGSGWEYRAWGVNKHGQLGISSYEECPMPQEVRKLRNKNIVDVAAGTNFTVVLTEEGELLGCGQNDEGQLGLGEHYQYLDSEEEQERKLEVEIQEKMNLKDAAEQKPEENGGNAVNEQK